MLAVKWVGKQKYNWGKRRLCKSQESLSDFQLHITCQFISVFYITNNDVK